VGFLGVKEFGLSLSWFKNCEPILLFCFQVLDVEMWSKVAIRARPARFADCRRARLLASLITFIRHLACPK
jgi:hypothetical protein